MCVAWHSPRLNPADELLDSNSLTPHRLTHVRRQARNISSQMLRASQHSQRRRLTPTRQQARNLGNQELGCIDATSLPSESGSNYGRLSQLFNPNIPKSISRRTWHSAFGVKREACLSYF